MDVSLSQAAELTCSQCNKPFTADVWLIVDTAARPDLLAQIRAGTLHDMPCPHCGHPGRVDAPLLVYRPDETPVLLFSPARGTSSEQDREHAAGLVNTLKTTLGDAWQDAWVAEGLRGVPRELLPTALSEGLDAALKQTQHQMEANPLLQAVQALLEAASPAEVLAAVQAHPALLSDEADTMLRQGMETARQMGNTEMATHIEQRCETLRQIRAHEINPETMVELAKAEEQITAALADLPEEMQRLLANISSPEELDAALEAHPELREALEAAAQQASAPQPREGISLAAAWPHTCPACGHRWDPNVWQIIDAQERPDLIARIHKGTLHTVTCPACGGSSAASAPLLYHDRSAEQLLLAAPDGWSSERRIHENRRLFPLLRAGLGISGNFPSYLEHTTHLHGGLPMLSRYLKGEIDAPATLPPELRRVVEALGPDLGQQFLEIMKDVSSQEELDTALEAHPELRKALAAAGGGSSLGEIPKEVQPLLQELSRPARRSDMPRRIQVCKQALSKIDRGVNAPLWGVLQNTLANSLAQTPAGDRAENLEQAIHHYTLALEVYTRQAFPDNHRRTQRNLAGLCFAEGHWGDTITAMQGALAASELLYQASATPEARRAELREIRDLPSHLAYALVKTSKGANLAPLQTAALSLEQNRARWLSETLARHSQKPPNIPEKIWQTFIARGERIEALQAELRLPEGTPGKREYLTLSEALAAARAALAETVDAIRAHAETFMPVPTFAQVRAAAANHGPLVYFAVSPAGTAALIVTTDAIHPVHTPLTEETLREQLQGPDSDPELGGYLGTYAAWRRASRDPAARKAWFTALEATTRWLGEVLMEPVTRALAERHIDHAVLIPTGRLGLLPLHAAGNGDGHPAITYTYAPNARALTAAKDAAESTPAAHTLLAIDNPDGSLRFSGEEVAAALDTFPDSQRLRLANDKATLAQVQQQLAQHDVWHFSTHGWAAPQKPLDGGLLLANGDHLTLREILALKARARLVMLSACETGIPGTELPDEVISLPTGLLQAGAAGVVGSLWSVNDFSTAMLMMRFYEAWREEGQTPPEALHTAQCWLREATNAELADYFHAQLPDTTARRLPQDVATAGYRRFWVESDADARPFEHPFYWAGFYYTGV